MYLNARARALGVTAAALAALTPACRGGAAGDACRTNADCDVGLYCDPMTATCTGGGGGDSAVVETDSGLPGVDSSMPGADSSVPGADSSVPGVDSAVTGTDSAVVGTDSSVPCVPLDCDDGNPCTDDACTSSGCANVNDDTNACDDGSVCSLDEACTAGVCAPTLFMACFEDGNPCTTASCDPLLGCQLLPNSAPCDDGDPCTVGDVCAASACVPGLFCDDADPATYDYCDRMAMACAFVTSCFTEDFEGAGPGTWSLGGDWQFVTSPETMSNAATCVASPPDHLPAAEGSGVLWYGDAATGNYSGITLCDASGAPTLGHAESEVITVPAGIAPEIAFWEWWEIECNIPYNYDFMSVWVNVDGAGFVAPLFVTNTGLQSCTGGGLGGTNGLSNEGASYLAGTPSTANLDGVWALRRLSLGFTTAATTTIQIRLRFNSADAIENSFRGWAVDDLALLCP